MYRCQVFDGEDLAYKERNIFQKEQLREWTSQQMQERKQVPVQITL